MLASMQSMWDNHRSAVDLLGTGSHWPSVTLTSPANNSVFPDTASVAIIASASDTLGSITLVEFFVSDTVKIGEASSPPYSMVWTNIPPNTYSITAVATNDQGHQRTSNRVVIRVGIPPMTRIEAEAASRSGPGMTIRNDNSASGYAYIDIATNDTNTSITWQVNNLKPAGSYEIAFGYRLAYASPKSQFINVNGTRAGVLEFTAPSSASWYEKAMTVNLNAGSNTVQMQMSWGWMYVDYLSVPTGILVASAGGTDAVPLAWSLEQNYPNPFNPATSISYALVKNVHVKLTVYDLLGREVEVLVDGTEERGNHVVTFDARRCASGVYFYRLQAGEFVATKQMILLR
jgi:hypothetical protein